MKFLAITDMHYSDRPQAEDSNRIHELSLKKLKKIISERSFGCDFIINLGDTADAFDGYKEQALLFAEAQKVFENSGLPYYSIIGNHDTATDKHEFCEIMKTPGRYYAFDAPGYRSIVLDACLNDVEKPYPEKEIEWDNCFIDNGQKEWLVGELQKAEKPVLIFTHVPFMLQSREIENPHNIINRDEILDILEGCEKVKAVFSGHYHDGCMTQDNEVPFVVFGALCIEYGETCAVVTVDEKALKIEGFGLNESRNFNLR